MIMIPLLHGCREREDLMAGGTSSAFVDDSQEGEGGFQEGYWRYVPLSSQHGQGVHSTPS